MPSNTPAKARTRKGKAAPARQEERQELEQAIERAAEYMRQDPEPQYVLERPRVDVREIRESLGMSRQDFAMTFGLSLRTLQNWEEGRREPEGPARTLLIAIKYEPEAVQWAVAAHRFAGAPANLSEEHVKRGGEKVFVSRSGFVKPGSVKREKDADDADQEMGGVVVTGAGVERLFHAAREVVEHPKSKESLHELGEVIAELDPEQEPAGR